MKTYTKSHTSQKAAEVHAAKIKARGGSVLIRKTDGGCKLTYTFVERKKEPKPKFKVNDIVAHTKFKTIGIVRLEDERGETKTNADGNVNSNLLEHYDPEKHTKKNGYTITPSTKKDPAFQKIYLPF